MTETLFIATPTFNSARTLDTTILSVLSQEGDFCIRYHIQDGGSTDETWNKLKHWQMLIDSGLFPKRCRGVQFSFSLESDRGMYDALTKAFDRLNAPADSYLSWINSDDWYNPGTFALINTLQSSSLSKEVSWLIGATAVNKNGFFSLSSPAYFPRDIIKAGLCDGTHWPFIQQEGSFFKAWLLEGINVRDDFQRFRLAGDWNLWRKFSDLTEPVCVDYPLGVFRSHEKQLTSTNYDKYLEELDTVIPKEKRMKAANEMQSKSAGLKATVLQTPYPMKDIYISNISCNHPYGGFQSKKC